MKEAILVYHVEAEGGFPAQWFACLKRAPGIHAMAATPAEAVAQVTGIAEAVERTEHGLLAGLGPFDPYTPCGSWGCGCCSPHWNKQAGETFTSLSGETQTHVVEAKP